MKYLIVLAALASAALAAPQVAYRPAPYQAYQPSVYSSQYKPLAYAAPAYKPAAAIAPAYKPYAAPVAPAYVAPVPAYKPVQYSAPAYQYTPQVAYSPQPQYTGQYVKPIAIVRQSQDDNFDGSFSYDFESENGISSQTSGYLKNAGSEAESQVIQGQYSYTAPDGTPIVTRWFADETGFHAEGAHIPSGGSEPYRTA